MAKVEITVNGVSYPCRTTMGAMLRFKRETGRDVTQMDQSLTDLTTFLWCCICSASAHDGLDFGLSLIDFADAVMPEDVMAWARANEPGDDGGEKKSTSQ